MPGADAPERTGAGDIVDSEAPAPDPAATNKNEFLVAPIPSYKPNFGFGLQVMAGYLFSLDPDDKVSPPSSVMLMGYGAENGSWLGGFGSRFFLKEDQYRVIGGVFTGRLNYDYAGVGTDAGDSGQTVPLEQNMTAVIVEPLTRIAPHLYLGPRYLYANMRVTADLASLGDPALPPAVERESLQSMIGAHLQYDTRDSVFYPTKGMVVDLHTDFHDQAWGDDFNYQVYKLFCNQYISLAEGQVLALRGAAQVCAGDVPFYSLATIGRGPDLRGYEYGQYQDKTLLAAQAEYRLRLTKRFGVVGFAGVGAVAPSLSDYSSDDLLPSVGAGLRYVLAEKNQISMRLDFAYGRDGGKLYFTVGEAF
jgi:outer membrane protein assembly factor BamA